jgi:hypothetical protein
MLEEIKKNKHKEQDYGNAVNMNVFEKKISFLNRYFVYKKMLEVNTEKVEIELGEYNETEIERNNADSEHAEAVGKQEIKKIKPKVRKLSKKLLLVPATEAIEEEQQEPEPEPEPQQEPQQEPIVIKLKERKTKEGVPKPKKLKAKLIIVDNNI